LKACRVCNRIIEEGNECAVCGSKDLTRSWKGIVVIWDVESEIAKKLNINAPGKYAIQVF
jgi:DNA-directed RNA polymerase subunit E"